MGLEQVIKSCAEAGVGVVAVSAILYMSWRLLRWGREIVKEVMTQAAKEREIWQGIVQKLNASIDMHSERAAEFHQGVREAHAKQREEHDRMIKALDEILSCLARLNGYKK